MANIFDSKDLEVVKQLEQELKSLRTEFESMSKTLKQTQEQLGKQAKSQSDLKKNTEQLNTAEKELQKLDKQLDTTTAKLTEEYKKKNVAVLKAKEALRQQNEEQKKSLGIQNKFVGGIKAGIAQFALMATAALGTIKAVQKFGKAVINSSQSLSDEWAVRTEQARAATNLFFKSLASGNFDNFFGRLKDVTDQARKYAEAIDRIANLNISLDIQEAEARDRLVELTIAARDVTKTYYERMAAIEEIKQIELGLANKRKEYTAEEKNQLLANIAMQTGISEKKIETYIREYQSIDDLLNKGAEYNTALIELGKQEAAGADIATRATVAIFNKKKIDEAKKALEAYGDEYRVGFGLLQMYGSLNDEEMEKLKQAYIKVAQAQSQYNENTRKVQTLIGTLNDEQRREFEAAEKAKQKAVEKRIAAEGKALREIDAANAESATFQIEIDKNIADEAIQNEIELNEILDEIDKERAQKSLELYEETNKKKEESDKKLADAKKELAEETEAAAKKIATDYFNAGIDERLNSFQEAQDIEETKLKNKLDKGVITEAEYERQIKALKLKTRQEEAKAEKKKALFDIAINTLVAIVKALPNVPLSVTVGAIGLASGIAVAAKPEPKFRHGTKGALKEGVYATVSEDGSEYFRNKKLGIEGLTPKFETKAFIPEGTEIFPAYSKETKEAKERVSNDGTITELRQIRKALSGKREKDIVTRQGAFHIIEQNNQRTISRKRLIN